MGTGYSGRLFWCEVSAGTGILPKDITMEMIVNDDIEIDGDIFGKNLTEKIALAKTMSERIEIFKKAYEDMVLGRNSLSDKEKINEYLVNRIGRTKGMITMRQLEDETNYSACYLRRIFKSFHGFHQSSLLSISGFKISIDAGRQRGCQV